MRRKPGQLLPIEVSILAAALDMRRSGRGAFHGYGIARRMRDGGEAQRLIAHGTLYRALERLEDAGLLESHKEDASLADAESRPRRRLYRVTAEGERAYQVAAAALPQESRSPSLRKGEAST